MKAQELNIAGMSCGHCVMSVKKELGKVPGIVIDEVQIGKAKIHYDESKVTEQTLARAIDEAGYTLISLN